MVEDPAISVVVIGRNEGERLRACLESVHHVNYPSDRMEYIYVDSDSSDTSREIAAQMEFEVIHVKSERPSAARARNAGWEAASHSLVLFLDGDTELEPDFVRQAVSAIRDDAVAVVWGHRREKPSDGLFNRVLDLDWRYDVGDSLFCGGDALVKRSVLKEVAGFDPALRAGEEPELCHRIRMTGYRILHIDVPMTRHDLAMHTLGDYSKRAFRSGFAYAEVAERTKSSPEPLWQRECRTIAIKGGVFVVLILCALLALLDGKLVTVLMFLAPIGSLVGWTTVKEIRRGTESQLAFWYGLHSQLQVIPLLMGQISYWMSGMGQSLKSLMHMLKGPLAWLQRIGERMSRLWAYMRLASSVKPQLPSSIVVMSPVEVHGTGNIHIGPDTLFFRDIFLETNDAGKISLGSQVVLSRGVHIASRSNISIGDQSMIGEYTSIRDANHRRDPTGERFYDGYDAKQITIGRGVWIGRGVTILPGVTIGDGAVIGANAVVTKDVAAGQTVVGIPARPLGGKPNE